MKPWPASSAAASGVDGGKKSRTSAVNWPQVIVALTAAGATTAGSDGAWPALARQIGRAHV